MSAATCESPPIPNHALLRVIGRGAYGEIWLARSLTGALRAVKIVRRRTFETEKTFQREFEGMSRFEPISRGDSGFVDILHVGRDEAGEFFYYVMELADDATGGHVDPEHYTPKTLRTELARRSRLLVEECIAVGLSLTHALAALHRHGLVHRDIKPANIIFVGGVPKIADIGLVAASGQGSFVGTEGYVPPEGPGSVQADVFSLGKVLYEIAMGKDRLDFPALHTDLTALPEKDRLLLLNRVLLRACAPDPRERYMSAEEMCADLQCIRDGRALACRRSRLRQVVVAALALGCVVAGGAWWQHSRAPGAVTIATEPPGAMVVLGDRMKRSPERFDRLRPGGHAARVMLAGFDPAEVRFTVVPGGHAEPPPVRLARSHGALRVESSPPGAEWTLTSGNEVIARGVTPGEAAQIPTGEGEVRIALEGREQRHSVAIKRDEITHCDAEFASGQLVITSEPAGAEIAVDGKSAGSAPLDLVLAEGAHELTAHFRGWPEERRAVQIGRAQPAAAAFAFPSGSMKITSAPGGATVLAGGRALGKTPLLLEELEPGAVRYELRLSGFKSQTIEGDVQPGQQAFIGARFVQRAGPQRGSAWENSLGMKFAPVGAVLMGVWPARVRDWEAFCGATSRPRSVADFPQDAAHPVVQVNWEDATAFCEWLTQKERAAGLLQDGQRYRLPTDAEWSDAAGIPPEGGATPEERDGKGRDFLWGRQWPPPAGAGNFADAPARRGTATISGYRDGFPQTSPVGTFAPNALGLHDMSGNVWQWVLEAYRGGSRVKDWGVLRGGSWGTATAAELRASYRNVVDRSERDVIFGFRVAVVVE